MRLSDSAVSPIAENPCNLEPQWFALRVKSRCEKVVAAGVRNKGFDEFLPVHRGQRQWSDRVRSVELPLFPGYVFCRLHPQHRLPVLTIPGVLHFVGTAKGPTPIEDAEIAAIQKAIRSGVATEPWPFLVVGQRVRIKDGPLTGLEGILAGNSKQQRLIVSVAILQRSVAVAIERRWAVPLSFAGAAACTQGPSVCGRDQNA